MGSERDELTQAGINNARIIKAYGELPSVKAAVLVPGHKHTSATKEDDVRFLIDKCSALEAERDALALLVEGKDGLLAAYRIGRPPSESTWKKLEKAKARLDALKGGEVNDAE